MHFQFYLFWPVLNFFVLALVLRNGGFAEVCLARKLKTPATAPILKRIKKLKYLMYSNAKVSSKLFMCVEYFLMYFDYYYTKLLSYIIIFICVWSTFWWGRRSRCPPRSGFPERQRCKPGWLEPAEEKEIGSLIILIAHTHTPKNKRLKHGKPRLSTSMYRKWDFWRFRGVNKSIFTFL